MTHRIGIHEDPELDAVVAVWLAQRYLSPSQQSEVIFFPRGQCLWHDADLTWRAESNVHSELFGEPYPRAKHKNLDERCAMSATGSIWAKLLSDGKPVAHLVDLVNAVHAGTVGRSNLIVDAPWKELWSKLNRAWGRANAQSADGLTLYRRFSVWLDKYDTGQGLDAVVPVDWQRLENQIPTEPGTYALVVQTAAPGPILVGRTGWRGRMDVEHGWYIYCGSAGGGVHGRQQHHLTLARDLKLKWQVDFLRLRCSVVEVWLTTDPFPPGIDLKAARYERECAMAMSVLGMPGASVPVSRFGATGCRCSAHLAYFKKRPSFGHFQGTVQHSAVPCHVQQIVLAKAAAATEVQRSYHLSHPDFTHDEAVKEIARNCGRTTERIIRPLPPEEIIKLAGTSPEYQHHVLNRIQAGHTTPFKKTAACTLVYETIAFAEIISRMPRALGCFRREVSYIAAQLEAKKPELNRGPDRLLTLALAIQHAEKLAAGIRQLPLIEKAEASRKRDGTQSGEPKQQKDKLQAAGGLGLLAKNIRNLPLLKPAHHPSAGEKRLALDLCETIVRLVRPILRSARQRWGNLDRDLWLRPTRTATRRIVTHDKPDGDAIVSAWLAERFLFAGENVEILFVPRERVLGCLRPGDCLVDVGNTFDPGRHLFDHKPPAMPSRHDSCAAKLVWEHLLALGKPVGHLEELVLAVFAWDSAPNRRRYAAHAAASKKTGFHAAIDAAKRQGLDNVALYRRLRDWLDRRWGR